MRPVFYRDELIAFTVVAGHWSDVGGSVPGSFDIEADEFYCEGVRIPATKIIERGVMKEDLVREITPNMRVSFERMGDLRSQLEASRVGAEQIVGLCEKVWQGNGAYRLCAISRLRRTDDARGNGASAPRHV